MKQKLKKLMLFPAEILIFNINIHTYFIGKVVNRDFQGGFFDHLINSIKNKKEFVTHKYTNA